MIVRRLSATHDMQFGHGWGDIAVDAEARAQCVRTRLLLCQEEWFLDTDAGVPYLQSIMVKPANLPLAESLIKTTILETPGVDSITSFEMLFDTATRQITVNVTVKTLFDDLTTIRVTI